MTKRKVLLIGWDAADWKVISPLLDAGKMPALESIVNRGVIGNMATLSPPLSPMLWTSIATGMRADKHGILGFYEPDTKHNSVRPVNVTSRKVKAIWNILQQQGFRSNVISWWPSHPAEPINGLYISNFFHKAGKSYNEPWPMPKKAVHPESLRKEIEALRVHPGELTTAHIDPFVHHIDKIDQDKDTSLVGVAKVIAEAASVQAAATWAMRNTEWDFMAVYFDAIDHFCHGFMKYHPPKMKHIPQELFEKYKDVVAGGYIFQDMMLERMIQLAGEDTTIIIISDHGFHADHLRIRTLPKFAAAPALEHNPLGIFCACGPGIKKDSRVFGATLLDITPTLLTLFKLPVGKDMDGKPLVNIFDEQAVPEYIDSWEDIDGECGMHDPSEIEDTHAAAEALQQLIELGYIEDPGDDHKAAMEKSSREAKYNLSKVYAEKRDFINAKKLLEELFENDHDDFRYKMDLIQYHIELKEFDKADDIIQALKQFVIDEQKDKKEKLIHPALYMLEGVVLLHKGESEKALEALKLAENTNPKLPVLHCEIGKVYLRTKSYHEAIDAFTKALQIDENAAVAYHGLAIAMLRLGKYEEAVDYALSAIGIIYHFPLAHFHLGEALFRLKSYEESAQAFEICLKMAPGIRKARVWLVDIYSENLPNVERADYHQKILDKSMQQPIYVVSGLPRSGTSMMMQMLEAGGIEPFTDRLRSADDNNPKGYYEYEKTKALAKDSSWIPETEGKAVKVIAQLLHHLPSDHKYKVIFMRRDMTEIVKSQQKMLGKKTDILPLALIQAFEKELEKIKVWEEKEPEVEVLYVNYADVINDTEKMVQKICQFIDLELNAQKMIEAVNPVLYRTKKI